ncbi:MAG: LolA family protein [Armatimonadota bacterium]
MNITRKLLLVCTAVAVLTSLCITSSYALTASDLLKKVKAAEASLKDFRAELVIEEANKGAISGMGKGYDEILRLEKAIVSYKKPDKIRYDGYAKGIKVTYIQDGYTKIVIAPMLKQKVNVKNEPGKRQDSLDLGFLSSRLWTDNDVSVVSVSRDGLVKLKLISKFGPRDKGHDLIWVDSKTLRLVSYEKYRGSGELRVRAVYLAYSRLTPNLPIATKSELFDAKGRSLGTVSYNNLKVNLGLSDSLFSLNQ